MTRNLLACALVALLSLPLIAQQAPIAADPTPPFLASDATPQPLVPPTVPPPEALPAANVPQLPQAHTLFDGTPIKLRLSETISSADAKVGQEVPFEVVEDVQVDDVTVLAKGGTAMATVTDVEPKKWAGRAGKLNINISYARLTDQEKVALRAVKESKGGGHSGVMTAGMVGTAIVFFPAAPLLLFIHGKDITIPQGTEITAYIEGDMHLDMARFAPAAPATVAQLPAIPAAPAAPVQVSLAIDSTPAGADIEVDGGFVGSTPSTVTVVPGSHQIAVKKKGFTDWTKTLNVTGGSIHLNADLAAAPRPKPKV